MQWKQWEYRIVVGIIFKFFSGSDAGRRYSKSDTSDISNGNGGANQRWLVVDANDGWQWTPTMVGNGRQRWLAMDANDGWQNHVIARSIYRAM